MCSWDQWGNLEYCDGSCEAYEEYENGSGKPLILYLGVIVLGASLLFFLLSDSTFIANVFASNGNCAVSSSYPKRVLRWCEPITRYARENGLKPNLVAALILVESGGNPRAYSKNGATGLMQIMPSDGIAAAQFPGVFRNRPTVNQLYDPEFNIRYGSKMLGNLVRKNGVRDGLRLYGPSDWGYRYADKVLRYYGQH